jgi:hypothetical protein
MILLLLLVAVFVARGLEITDQWRDVEQGEQLPPGVHVRMNLQTGHKQVKWDTIKRGNNNAVTTTSTSTVQYNLTAKEWEEVLTALGMKAENPFDLFNNNLDVLTNKLYKNRTQLEEILADVDQGIRDVDISIAILMCWDICILLLDQRHRIIGILPVLSATLEFFQIVLSVSLERSVKSHCITDSPLGHSIASRVFLDRVQMLNRFT